MARPRVPKKTNGEAGVQPAQPASATFTAAETTTASSPEPSNTSSRKPSIVKSDARANLVPINLEDEVRRLAYLLSERRGFEPGHETEDWLTAEREVRQRYHQQSA
ncbi:MAG TPA: DUF2934 domain-containing protein [Candidatus Sulfotelmatobacter sp.]|nr:DUF2934 domain-containing protein [Candidatus Sulfotelmatobacter sp.]